MTDGIESLLPPAVAIILALLTRRVLFPLAIGIFVGTWLLASKEDGGVASTLIQSSKQFFFTIDQSVRDWDHLHVLAFTLLLGGMVGVLESAGSMARMISGWTRRVSTRRGGQTLIGFTGLLIFFDDYANTLLVGGTMRTTAERYGISRAKLAYLVDSTAAPVAGLTLVSTWVATELSYLQTGLTDAGIETTNMTSRFSCIAFPIASIRFWRCGLSSSSPDREEISVRCGRKKTPPLASQSILTAGHLRHPGETPSRRSCQL